MMKKSKAHGGASYEAPAIWQISVNNACGICQTSPISGGFGNEDVVDSGETFIW